VQVAGRELQRACVRVVVVVVVVVRTQKGERVLKERGSAGCCASGHATIIARTWLPSTSSTTASSSLSLLWSREALSSCFSTPPTSLNTCVVCFAQSRAEVSQQQMISGEPQKSPPAWGSLTRLVAGGSSCLSGLQVRLIAPGQHRGGDRHGVRRRSGGAGDGENPCREQEQCQSSGGTIPCHDCSRCGGLRLVK
jgi:hypothetical protein